jgi:hypothetical protein
MSQPTDAASLSSFHSGLDQAPARFLSRIIQHTLQNDWQTPDDFVQHFAPSEIMRSLAHVDALRSKLLVTLANVHEKIASKKSIDSAAEDLRLALEEGITTAEAVVEAFPADERVKYLKGSSLWNFMFEDPFYKTTHADGETAHARAVRRMTFLIECALDEQILNLETLADGLGFECIAEYLPPDELRQLVVSALQRGRQKEPLTEPGLLEVVAMSKLLGHIPLEVTWQHVMLDRIAKTQGWVEGEPAKATQSTAGSSSPRSSKRSSEVAVPAPKSDRAVESTEPRSEVGAGAQDEARARAVQRLKEIDRLPPRHEELSTPIMLSIESMYEDLLQASSDDERAESIRESFPNDAHLRTAMFALAELLEPSIDVSRPPICDADTDALVKLVVFEERKRKDGDGGMRRSSVRPPPLPMGRSASSIPAARVSAPPKNER